MQVAKSNRIKTLAQMGGKKWGELLIYILSESVSLEMPFI